MTSKGDPIDAAAQALVRARGGPPADDRAFSVSVTSPDQACAVQDRAVALLDGRAGCPGHWKSGAPTSADAPKHAPLPAAGVRSSGADMGDLQLRHRWIEAEVALRIARDVGPDEAQRLTVQEAGALVDSMCVSIEVLDSRWLAGRDAAPVLKLADLLMHGGLVLGGFVPFTRRAWDQQECSVRIGDGSWQLFRGSLGVGEPAWVLPAWLRHVTRNAAAVPAGTVVTTGTWCGLLQARRGDRVTVEFPGIGSASVQL